MLDDCILDLEKLENLRPSNDGCYVARCPICALEGKDKKGMHLSITPQGVYNCIMDGAAHNPQIFQLIGKEGDGIVRETIIQQPQVQITQSWEPNLIKGLVKDYSYWEKRGISAEICQKFDIGIATKGQMVSRSVIPIFDKDKTKLVGFTGRKLDNSGGPKYKHVGNKSIWCWPNTFNRDNGNKIIIVESPADSLYLYSRGITNNVCLFGVNISGTVISYLIKINPSVILIGTNNEVSRIGNEAAEKIYNILIQFFSPERLKIALPIGGKDFGELSDEALSHWKTIYL